MASANRPVRSRPCLAPAPAGLSYASSPPPPYDKERVQRITDAWVAAFEEAARRRAAELVLGESLTVLSVRAGETFAETHGLVPPPQLAAAPADAPTERLLVTMMASEVGGRLMESAFRRGRKLLPPLPACVNPYLSPTAGDPAGVRNYLFYLQQQAFTQLTTSHHLMWILAGELRAKGALDATDVSRCRELKMQFDPGQQLGVSTFLSEMAAAGAVR